MASYLPFLANEPITAEMELRDRGLRTGDIKKLVKAIINAHVDTTVTTLWLHGNALNNDSCSPLASWLSSPACGLTHLSLSHNDIGNKGTVKICATLKTNRTLTYLSMRGNRVKHRGAEAIARVIASPSCIIEEISLEGNPLTDKGVIHIFKALLTSRSMRYLSLQDTQLTDGAIDGLTAMLSSMPRTCPITDIYLAGSNVFSVGAIKHLAATLSSTTTSLRALTLPEPLREDCHEMFKACTVKVTFA